MSFRASEASLSLGTRTITLNAYKMRNRRTPQAFAAEKSPGLRFRYTFTLLCLPVAMGRWPRGERADGGGENSNYIFLFVILSDSEGSLCPSISVFGQRCLGNARSRSVCPQLFRRAARHDKGWVRGSCACLPREEYVISTEAHKVCETEKSPRVKHVISTEERRRRSQRRNLPGYASDTLLP